MEHLSVDKEVCEFGRSFAGAVRIVTAQGVVFAIGVK